MNSRARQSQHLCEVVLRRRLKASQALKPLAAQFVRKEQLTQQDHAFLPKLTRCIDGAGAVQSGVDSLEEVLVGDHRRGS